MRRNNKIFIVPTELNPSNDKPLTCEKTNFKKIPQIIQNLNIRNMLWTIEIATQCSFSFDSR